MNRLLKCEIYKLKHSKQLIKFFIFSCFLIAFFPLINYLDSCNSLSDVTAEIGITFYAQSGIMLIIVFIPNLICAYIDRGFRNKTILHEIMEGHSNKNIILSRVISCVTVVIIGVMTCILLYLGILAIINGKGDTLDYLEVRVILIAIFLIHVSLMSVLLCMIFRNGILAALVIYFRCALLDLGIVSVVKELIPVFSTKISNFFFVSQWPQITTGEVNANLVIAVIGSLIIENGILFLIALYRMNKKEFR